MWDYISPDYYLILLSTSSAVSPDSSKWLNKTSAASRLLKTGVTMIFGIWELNLRATLMPKGRVQLEESSFQCRRWQACREMSSSQRYNCRRLRRPCTSCRANSNWPQNHYDRESWCTLWLEVDGIKTRRCSKFCDCTTLAWSKTYGSTLTKWLL